MEEGDVSRRPGRSPAISEARHMSDSNDDPIVDALLERRFAVEAQRQAFKAVHRAFRVHCVDLPAAERLAVIEALWEAVAGYARKEQMFATEVFEAERARQVATLERLASTVRDEQLTTFDLDMHAAHLEGDKD